MAKEQSTRSGKNKAVNDDYGGQERFPWSPAQLRAAFLTYFRSLKDSLKRKQRSGVVDHNMQKTGKDEREISRRRMAVDSLYWEERKKERCKRFIVKEYTSSDESEMSEDEDGCDVKCFVVKRLPWESTRLRELKDLLDLTYKKSLAPHVRNLQMKRVVGETCSKRGPPADAPMWTLGAETPSPLTCSTPARGND